MRSQQNPDIQEMKRLIRLWEIAQITVFGPNPSAIMPFQPSSVRDRDSIWSFNIMEEIEKEQE